MSQERFSSLDLLLIENIIAEKLENFHVFESENNQFSLNIFFYIPAFPCTELFLFEIIQLIVIDAFIY